MTLEELYRRAIEYGYTEEEAREIVANAKEMSDLGIDIDYELLVTDRPFDKGR